ncbi:oligosaccharide flippase family protein [Pseudomonas sp. EA_15y_Pfl1_P104]|uniref:oligosaccharide flippase family protein n=1 Tax=Pseudomonas sp. EA_15y_Pfl1_P104 TaxID=3088686 RepID=UPI0030DC6430
MSLKKNIIVNYISYIYITFVGVLVLPLYIKYMGAEAYGLIGFFTVLQAWFALLDLGLTPTVGRETARYRAGAISDIDFLRLFRALHCLFFVLALSGGIIVFLSSSVIVNSWLNLQVISPSEAGYVVKIMACCISFRWMCGLYRGVISGNENMVWLGYFGVILATLRFVVVVPVMFFWGFEPRVFFVYQLFIAFVEVLLLLIKSRFYLPRLVGVDVGWSFAPVKKILAFSMTIAFTASMWVMVTQLDKLILSSILPLSVYGYFALSVLIASGVMVTVGPISNAIMPRMVSLHSSGKSVDVLKLYRDSTQLTAVIAGSAALTLAFCARPLLWAWTGDEKIVEAATPTLILYALGNGCLAVAAFPYYLQYARGDLKLHFWGNFLLLILMVPAVYFAAHRYGMIGAGYSWMTVNVFFLFVWVWFVHAKLEKGLHLNWIFKDVLVILLPAALCGFAFKGFYFGNGSRIVDGFFVLGCGFSITMVAASCSSFARRMVSSFFLRGRNI